MKKIALFLFALACTSSLFADPLSIDEVMTKEEQEKTGLSSLTASQKKEFEAWLEGFVRKVINQAPIYHQGDTLSQWMKRWPKYLSPTQNPTNEEAAIEKQLLNRRIDKNKNNGAILELHDGSVWQIAEVDRYKTKLWRRTDQLSWTKDPYDIAFPYRLNNDTKLQIAYAKQIAPPSPTGEKAAENPKMYAGSLAIQKITIVRTQSTNVKKVYPTDVTLELVDNTSWIVAPIDMVKADDWTQGDRIKVNKTNDPLYKYRLTNLDTGEEVLANKKP